MLILFLRVLSGAPPEPEPCSEPLTVFCYKQAYACENSGFAEALTELCEVEDETSVLRGERGGKPLQKIQNRK